MPSPNKPSYIDALRMMSDVHRDGMLLRVSCCHVRYYRPEDLIRLFGDFSAVKIDWHVKRCGRCGARELRFRFVILSAEERQRIRVRRLVEIKMIKRPIWRDE